MGFKGCLRELPSFAVNFFGKASFFRQPARLPWLAQLWLWPGVFSGGPEITPLMPYSLFRTVFLAAALTAALPAQNPPISPEDRDRPEPQHFFSPVGPPSGEERKILKQFDEDGDGLLSRAERTKARQWLKENPAPRRGPGGPGGPGGGFGGPGGFRPRPFPGLLPLPGLSIPAPTIRVRGPGGPGGPTESEPTTPGPNVSPADVPSAGSRPLYAEDVLRTFFLEFEDEDWERALEEFHDTDVELPATLIVDGERFPNVGVHFRGMSSYFMVRAGQKRSLNVTLDLKDKQQRLGGYKTLNLLNSHEDDTLMSTVLFSHIARQYLPAPKANFVRVVINGKSWGLYVNAQQFNKEFVRENFHHEKGARWKVRGSPAGGGGLEYLGEDVAEYKRHYEMKSGGEDDWKAFIALCRTLRQTPPEQLEAALNPILDVDGLLWFLAIDCGLINTDGYWIRASDFSIYREPGGKFHILPHDMNEAFRQALGPGFGGLGRGGFGGGPGGDRRANGSGDDRQNAGNPNRERLSGAMASGGGVELDPLVGMNDETKPLRSRVLAVPALRDRYLAHVRTLAEKWLDWKKLGPLVAEYRALIEKEVAADTRKFGSLAKFQALTAEQAPADVAPSRGPEAMPLRSFADQRRTYLLKRIPPSSETAASK
jgi:spore coat protein CotH